MTTKKNPAALAARAALIELKLREFAETKKGSVCNRARRELFYGFALRGAEEIGETDNLDRALEIFMLRMALEHPTGFTAPPPDHESLSKKTSLEKHHLGNGGQEPPPLVREGAIKKPIKPHFLRHGDGSGDVPPPVRPGLIKKSKP